MKHIKKIIDSSIGLIAAGVDVSWDFIKLGLIILALSLGYMACASLFNSFIQN